MKPGLRCPRFTAIGANSVRGYVTALCFQENGDAQPQELRVASPEDEELERVALAAPPMMGAEYLTTAVLRNLWRELDAAFGIELSESKCGVQDFLKRRNPAWNLVGRVHFNLAENRKDPDSLRIRRPTKSSSHEISARVQVRWRLIYESERRSLLEQSAVTVLLPDNAGSSARRRATITT